MRLNSIGFLLREALNGLIRHRLMTLAAISTSAISFTVMGGFIAVMFTLNAISSNLMSQLGISLYMKEASDRSDTLATRTAVSRLPGVESAVIVTREEAWGKMKDDLGDQVPLQGVKDNPLTDEIHIRLTDVDHVAPVVKATRAMDGVADVRAMTDVVRRVQATVRLTKTLGAGAAGLLLLATFVVIANVIRLTVFARRREIRIMQLVGATNGFIRTPFLLEGLVYGCLGAASAGAVVFYGGQRILEFSHRTLPFMPLDPSAVPVRPLFVALIAIGGVVGLVGSSASVRKFLHT
ncbi:MAG TPA: permease-like cell division protein FtsX [Armatimonadota bacterium]|jgi:cell division transport system permease protein